MTQYTIGKKIQVTATFTSAGVPTDPTNVSFSFKTDATGAVTTYVFGVDAQLVRDGTGVYHVLLDTSLSGGQWHWKFFSTGDVQDAFEGVFYVIPTAVTPSVPIPVPAAIVNQLVAGNDILLSPSSGQGIIQVDLDKRQNNIRYAHKFAGVNAGAKIAAAIADLPGTGGIVDARGFEGAQAITQNILAGVNSTKPIVLLFGNAGFTVTVTQSPAISTYGIRIIGTATSGDTMSSGTYKGTKFFWNGSNGGTVFLFDGVRDSVVEGISINPGTGTIGTNIQINDSLAAVSTNMQFRHVTLQLSANGKGFRIGNTGQGNDLHRFEHCEVVGSLTYTNEYGVYIDSGQSKFNKFNDCHFVSLNYGIAALTGSYQAEDCNFANCVNDNAIGSNDPILIKGCQSEGANKFLKALGASGVAYGTNVTLMNNRGATNNVGGDNIYLQYYARGPLVLINNQFFDGTARSSVKVDIQCTAGVQVISIGNVYWDKDLFIGTPNDTQVDLVSLGDHAQNNSGAPIDMPLILGNTAWANYSGNWFTLANGDNNNLVTAATASSGVNTPSYMKIGGPTGAFAITGFQGGAPAREIKIFNTTAQQMTIKNENANSTAANRIKTLTGADVVLRTGTSFAQFFYDTNLARWILTSSN